MPTNTRDGSKPDLHAAPETVIGVPFKHKGKRLAYSVGQTGHPFPLHMGVVLGLAQECGRPMLQREQIGSWKERGDLQRELNVWISQYVADMDNPAPGVRSRRPLRKASISVEDVEGQPGWYKCSMKIRPHFKYMGASFELSLVGKLDKE